MTSLHADMLRIVECGLTLAKHGTPAAFHFDPSTLLNERQALNAFSMFLMQKRQSSHKTTVSLLFLDARRPNNGYQRGGGGAAGGVGWSIASLVFQAPALLSTVRFKIVKR